MEECYCLQYRSTCDAYAGTAYALYVEPYCTIADCCDGQPVGGKATCLPDDDEIDEIIDTIAVSSDNTAEVGEEEVESEPTTIDNNMPKEEEGEEPTASVSSGSIISGGVALVAIAFVVGLFD